jgi:hypothetical protein
MKTQPIYIHRISSDDRANFKKAGIYPEICELVDKLARLAASASIPPSVPLCCRHVKFLNLIQDDGFEEWQYYLECSNEEGI